VFIFVLSYIARFSHLWLRFIYSLWGFSIDRFTLYGWRNRIYSI